MCVPLPMRLIHVNLHIHEVMRLFVEDVIVNIAAVVEAEALWCGGKLGVQRLEQCARALCIPHHNKQNAAAALQTPKELAAGHQLLCLPLVFGAGGH